MSRIISFAKQRMLFTFVIFGIGFAFTTAILWGHIEGVIGKNGYQTLAKAGLILLPAVALIMTIWELFVDKIGPGRVHALHPTVKRLVDWCFWGSLLLLAAELVHAGALLKYESSTAEQTKTIAAVGDAQAKIAGASTSAAIESAGKTAQQLNATGQRKTASKIVTTGKDASAAASTKASEEVSKVANSTKPTTFLPAWYIDGGMYAALPLLAALFFGITMGLARQAAPYVDADDDGIPDAEERRQEQEEPKQWRSPVPNDRSVKDEAVLCDNCGFKKAYRIYGRKSVDPDIAAIEARFPVEAERFRSDKRNLCGDCYFNCLYEMKDEVEFPSELDTDIREEPEKPRLRQQPQKSDTGRQSPSVASFDRREALLKLREHLKGISFQNPGLWFKSDLKGSGVTIRLYRKNEGREEIVASTTQSNKLLQSVDRPDFRQRLTEELIYQGFPIEQGRSH